MVRKWKKSRFTTTATPRQKSNVGICRISTALRRSCHNFHLSMALSARLCLGEGALCSCLVKFIRPSNDVATALVNPKPGRCTNDLIALSRDVTTRGGKRFASIFFRAALSPASSTLRSDGLRWKSKGHLISFGRMQLRPKRPLPLLQSTRMAK
jgi:hypothetical protein